MLSSFFIIIIQWSNFCAIHGFNLTDFICHLYIFSSPDDGIKLKDLWNILQIESFQLSELKKSTDQQGICDELGFGVKSKEKGKNK